MSPEWWEPPLYFGLASLILCTPIFLLILDVEHEKQKSCPHSHYGWNKDLKCRNCGKDKDE